MAQGLSSLLGGLAQGFTDLGKSTLDVLGGGTTNNVLTAGLDALINKKSYGQAVKDANQRQKDFRKWLYETDSDKDAAAKGLGTALNGAQTAIDLIPGLGQAAPVNAIQGAIGGLADEFKFNGENYDWGKGAQRAAVGAGAGLAAGGLGKALANSGSKVLSNGVLKGAATGSLGGALSQAGGTAIEGGNADQILQSAAQGAQFGALLGAGTGGVQSLAGALKKTRAKNSAPAIMDEEAVMAELAPDYSNRIAEAQAELENIGPVSLFAKDAESQAKRARIMELNDNIKAWQNGYENAGEYSAAHEAKRANRKPYEAPEAKYQPRMGETTLEAAPAQEGYTRLYRGLENDFDPKYLPSVDDNPFGYESWTDNYNLAKQYGNNVYSVDVPTNRIAEQVVTADGERVPVVKTTKKAGLNGVDGVEYMLNANDPLRQELEYKRIIEAPADGIMASRVAPGQLGLFDQTQTTTPKTATAQLGLFDQPTQPVAPKTIDVADVNPYAPVNGKITQAMRDRAAEIENMAMTRKIPENELFNRVDPETLPKGRAQVAEYLDEAYKHGIDPGKMLKEKVAEVYQEKFGEAPDRDRLEKFVFGDVTPEERARKIYDYFGTNLIPSEDTLGEMAKTKIREKIVNNELSPITLGDRTVRGGYTGSLDTMLSERLGIAPGYTYKKTGKFDTGDAYGRFESWNDNKALNNIMVEPALDNENAISTMAHERLHSFQEEAKTPDTEKRFSPEVRAAYEELAKDLREAKAYKSGEEIKKLYYGNVPYWRKHIEQEARMLQQYLNENGYTDSPRARKKHYYKDDNGDWKVKDTEFDNERINPAFDKFFDKLRELSKKGVALPAILAALGLGEYATENQEEDKDNGQQI